MPNHLTNRDVHEASRRLGQESYLLYQRTTSSTKREQRERALIKQALRQGAEGSRPR